MSQENTAAVVSAEAIARHFQNLPEAIRPYCAYLHNTNTELCSLLLGPDAFGKSAEETAALPVADVMEQLKACEAACALLEKDARAFSRHQATERKLGDLDRQCYEFFLKGPQSGAVVKQVLLVLEEAALALVHEMPELMLTHLRRASEDEKTAIRLIQAYDDLDLLMELVCYVEEPDDGEPLPEDTPEDIAAAEAVKAEAQVAWADFEKHADVVTVNRLGIAMTTGLAMLSTLLDNPTLLQKARRRAGLEDEALFEHLFGSLVRISHMIDAYRISPAAQRLDEAFPDDAFDEDDVRESLLKLRSDSISRITAAVNAIDDADHAWLARVLHAFGMLLKLFVFISRRQKRDILVQTYREFDESFVLLQLTTLTALGVHLFEEDQAA